MSDGNEHVYCMFFDTCIRKKSSEEIKNNNTCDTYLRVNLSKKHVKREREVLENGMD